MITIRAISIRTNEIGRVKKINGLPMGQDQALTN